MGRTEHVRMNQSYMVRQRNGLMANQGIHEHPLEPWVRKPWTSNIGVDGKDDSFFVAPAWIAGRFFALDCRLPFREMGGGVIMIPHAPNQPTPGKVWLAIIQLARRGVSS